MSENRSKYEYMYMSMLGSRVARKYPLYQELAGADAETSLQIALLHALADLGILDLESEEVRMTLVILNAKRMALFATSEKTNELSKMAMHLPTDEEEVNLAEPKPSAEDGTPP